MSEFKYCLERCPESIINKGRCANLFQKKAIDSDRLEHLRNSLCRVGHWMVLEIKFDLVGAFERRKTTTAVYNDCRKKGRVCSLHLSFEPIKIVLEKGPSAESPLLPGSRNPCHRIKKVLNLHFLHCPLHRPKLVIQHEQPGKKEAGKVIKRQCHHSRFKKREAADRQTDRPLPIKKKSNNNKKP